MMRIATLLCLRSLYPHFLLKRGSIVHVLFLVCLCGLLAAAFFGLYSALKLLLDAYAVPFASLLACGASTVGLWGLVSGIRYGVAYA